MSDDSAPAAIRVVLGLGNPGRRYAGTRHNLGCEVVERLVGRFGGAFARPPELFDRADASLVRIGGAGVLLARSRSWMNRSGRAAVALCRAAEAAPEQMLVVYDDADLALGRIRIRPEGRAGGHNGMRSIMDALRTTAFPRVRLGVRGAARGEAELADYVLEPFDEDERPVADALVELAGEAVVAVVERGMAEAMNAFNGRHAGPPGEGGPEREDRNDYEDDDRSRQVGNGH